MNRSLTTLGVVLSSLVLAAGCGWQAEPGGAAQRIGAASSQVASDAPRVARGPLPRPALRPRCRHSPGSAGTEQAAERARPLCLRRMRPGAQQH